MGDHAINNNKIEETRSHFVSTLLDDIEALDIMLKEGIIESGITRIGAEQEFCLVTNNWRPASNSKQVLQEINDPHFTTELARYNLEINLDPVELKMNALSQVEKQLTDLLGKAHVVSKSMGSKIILTGILPTISQQEIGLDYMTEEPRYFALNELLRKYRGSDFQVSLTGVEDFSIKHNSVMYEACNTSFQMHLQIDPEDFISSYNWAQTISGPVLALCVNSPLLLGRELWSETRIALFQQSIDLRKATYALTDKQARVTFGDRWASGTITDIFKHEVSKFKIILSKNIGTNALEELEKGNVPKLEAMNLHNSTIYRWNRPCYGVGGGMPHIRIENRYIPSGPTILDEMANFAFWVGLMKGRPQECNHMPNKMDFRDVKANFLKAAQHGTESIMKWMGKEYPLKNLVLDALLPIAHDGLKKVNIDDADRVRLLSVIENRVNAQTGSSWIIQNYRSLRKSMKKDDALLTLTESMFKNQVKDVPVHQWEQIKPSKTVHSAASELQHIMSTQLVTVAPEDIAELTLKVMQWRKIRHLPVQDVNEKLVGLLTHTHIGKLKEQSDIRERDLKITDIMVKNVITASPKTPIKEAISLMKKKEIGCLPVLQEGQLVGIVTIPDLEQFDNA